MEQETHHWPYIHKTDGWGSVQISPDGGRLLVKEVKTDGRGGTETRFFLIDVDTCIKSQVVKVKADTI